LKEDQLKRLSELEHKWLEGTISPEEEKEYMDWINRQENEANDIYVPSDANEQDHKERLFYSISSRIVAVKDNSMKARRGKVAMIGKRTMRYAAAILLVVALGSTIYFLNRPSNTALSSAQPVSKENNILPGGNKAVLILADGRTIVLDSAHRGQLAEQTGAKVIKTTDGELEYRVVNNLSNNSVVSYNTMTTPKGGQYQLRLPDGTRVWLNSSSTIFYPTVFAGKKRSVTISGEVYFEVAKNKNMPFIVNVDGKSSIEVLGTAFNINTYNDEGAIKTTLIEGSVKVSHDFKSVVLKPGQQSQQAEDLRVVSQFDIDQVIAWKNGYFNFNDVNIQKAMSQIARWYDIEVIYKGKIPDDVLVGKIPMGASITKVLNILEKIGVKFTVEGKKILVTS
jgi:transmembrane sensor